jgi:putative CRISPR-associated protein (TIGR02619 family)
VGLKLAVLNTVGTSILSNLESRLRDCTVEGRAVSAELCELLKMRPSRQPPYHETHREFEKRAYRDNPVFREVFDIVASSPGVWSAELNALLALFRSLEGVDEAEIYLYPTDTGTARFCAAVIYHLLRERGQQLLGASRLAVYEPIVVRGFGTGVQFFKEGLIELVDKYARLIASKTRAGYRVVVNATAGFKPESSYVTLIALMSCAWKVVYVHESFREVVELPMLPLSISERYREILAQIRSHATRHELEGRGVNVDELISRGLVEEEDGRVRVREWVRRLLEVSAECAGGG